MHPTPNSVAPADEHNARLVANVHPLGWCNPTPPRERYHLVVLGAGTAGLVTAAAAAALGARVALVERHLMGGDCLNVGCVPSKGLIAAARAWHGARTAAPRFGGPATRSDHGSFGAAMERMRRLRADLSSVDSAQRYAGLGVDVYFGHARFTASDRGEVGGRELRFRRAVIATGARAAVPPVPGLQDVGYYTNETIFMLTEPPARLLVLGAGPIGCELAQAFARLGSRVTVLQRANRTLPRDDPDAARIVEAALQADGVTLELGARAERVTRTEKGIRVQFARGAETGEVECDAILVAAGRAPNVEDLGLEAAGVRTGKHGVEVDDRLRTGNRRIYAVGDVCSRHRFTHVADFHARLVVGNALFFGRGRASRLVIPWATYTSPEVAHVGLTPAEAEQRGIALDTVTVPLDRVDRAVLAGDGEGFFRVHLRRGTDRLAGVTVVAPDAGNLIAEAALAMTNRLGLAAIGRTIHPYPTLAEAYRKAADLRRRERLTPRAARILRLWFRVFA